MFVELKRPIREEIKHQQSNYVDGLHLFVPKCGVRHLNPINDLPGQCLSIGGSQPVKFRTSTGPFIDCATKADCFPLRLQSS